MGWFLYKRDFRYESVNVSNKESKLLSEVLPGCVVVDDTPNGIYLFKINNGNTRAMHDAN